MAAIMQISASSCRLRVSIEALVALDRVSDVYSSFPGMCVIALSNRVVGEIVGHVGEVCPGVSLRVVGRGACGQFPRGSVWQ